MKIAFVYQQKVSFVAKDLDILGSEHELRELRFGGLKQIVELWRAVGNCDLVFCWFGKLHAFFAVLFSKLRARKSVVVAGGDDVAREPGIRYGLLAHPMKRWFALFIFRYADLVLAFSEYSRSEAINNAGADAAKVKRLYLGFDHRRIRAVPGINKDAVILSVGGVRRENLRRKGLELFVRTAALLPDHRFVLVGAWLDDSIEHLRSIACPNVEFTGRTSDAVLLRLFSLAEVYVQVSLHEGFGSSVAEAMLCECVPVVSRRAALPEVVGDCGFYVDKATPEAVARQIEKALHSTLGPHARERIIREFPLETRREALLSAVDQVMHT